MLSNLKRGKLSIGAGNSKIFYVHPDAWVCVIQFDLRIYFSNGLVKKTPTRWGLYVYTNTHLCGDSFVNHGNIRIPIKETRISMAFVSNRQGVCLGCLLSLVWFGPRGLKNNDLDSER